MVTNQDMTAGLASLKSWHQRFKNMLLILPLSIQYYLKNSA